MLLQTTEIDAEEPSELEEEEKKNDMRIVEDKKDI